MHLIEKRASDVVGFVLFCLGRTKLAAWCWQWSIIERKTSGRNDLDCTNGSAASQAVARSVPVENRAGDPHRNFEKGDRLHGCGVNLFLQYQLWVEIQESTVFFAGLKECRFQDC